MAAILGCIADDFTGGTDLAGMLVKHGMRTVQMIGVPQTERCPADVDAVVIALKSRTNPASEAVRESLAALRWLQEAGCKQFYFKYCSTFDSTPQDNIGPVLVTGSKDCGQQVQAVAGARTVGDVVDMQIRAVYGHNISVGLRGGSRRHAGLDPAN